MLRVLMNRYSPKAGNALLKFLPAEEMKQVLEQEINSSDITPILFQSQKIMENIHYSWLKSRIEKFSPDMQALLLGALTPIQAANLQKVLNITPISLSKPIKTFFINYLYSIFDSKQHIPIEYLIKTDLFSLAQWSKKELTLLIDFLGLHDLALEIRKIVNKQYLENIYSSLSPNQLYYLRVCLYQKEKLVAPKLGINPAEKNPELLKTLVHQRGLFRLGKALCGQHPDLVWYIVHTLDIGRGKIIAHYYRPKPIPNVTSVLKLQVNNVMNFLKKSKT